METTYDLGEGFKVKFDGYPRGPKRTIPTIYETRAVSLTSGAVAYLTESAGEVARAVTSEAFVKRLVGAFGGLYYTEQPAFLGPGPNGLLHVVKPASFYFENASTSHFSLNSAFLAQMERSVKDGNVDGAVDRIFERIERAFAQGDVSCVEDLLCRVDPHRLPARLLVAILRSSFRARGKLPSWLGLLAGTYRVIAESGGDAKRMLRGLA